MSVQHTERMGEGHSTFGGVAVGEHVCRQPVARREHLPEVLQPPPPAQRWAHSLLCAYPTAKRSTQHPQASCCTLSKNQNSRHDDATCGITLHNLKLTKGNMGAEDSP